MFVKSAPSQICLPPPPRQSSQIKADQGSQKISRARGASCLARRIQVELPLSKKMQAPHPSAPVPDGRSEFGASRGERFCYLLCLPVTSTLPVALHLFPGPGIQANRIQSHSIVPASILFFFFTDLFISPQKAPPLKSHSRT